MCVCVFLEFLYLVISFRFALVVGVETKGARGGATGQLTPRRREGTGPYPWAFGTLTKQNGGKILARQHVDVAYYLDFFFIMGQERRDGEQDLAYGLVVVFAGFKF